MQYQHLFIRCKYSSYWFQKNRILLVW